MAMSDAWIPRIVYGFLLGMGALDWVRRYLLLPARMASHFGPRGEVSMKMGWFGCALLFLQLLVVSQAINANIPRTDHLISVRRSRCCSGL
jgi:hypothetical protein